MLEVFKLSVDAIMPTFILIALGVFIKQKGILSDKAVREFNKVTFYIFSPAMFFRNIYNTGGVFNLNIITVILCFAICLVSFIIGFVAAKLKAKDYRDAGVIQQSIFRGNMMLFGIAIAQVMLTTEELGVYSLAMMFVLPLQNIGSAIAQLIYSEEKNRKFDFFSIVKGIVLNPMNYGIILGLIAAWINLQIPSAIWTVVDNMGNCSVPLGSIILGTSLNIKSVPKYSKTILLISVIRLLVLPALLLPVINIFDLPMVESFILMMTCAAPSAATVFTLSLQSGWDAELCSSGIIGSTVLSFFTMTLWITVLNMMIG